MSRVLGPRLRSRIHAFRSERSASINVVFALSLLPMVGLVGLGVDYGVAQSVKTKLDNAADSAAVAAVATAKAYVADNSSDPNLTADATAAGIERAGRAFAANAGALPFAQVPSVASGSLNISLTRSTDGITFSSSVNYKTATQNHFGQLFGSPLMNMGGSSAASASIPQYLDFYLLVDVSGSMGLPSTSSGQTQLSGKNNGCQFACHYPGNSNGFNTAISNNIQLRSGAVNTAVCALLVQASAPLVSNQYRVGIYPFITQLGTLASLSSTITNVQLQAGCTQSNPNTFTNLLDTGTTQEATSGDPSTGTGSGGTHFDLAFPAIQNIVASGAGYGNGSASNKSRPFIFLITDGMNNSQYYGTQTYQNQKYSKYFYPGNPSSYSGYSNAGFTGSNPQPINSSVCSSLKQAGATISVLYIPYAQLTVGTTDVAETQQANTASPKLPAALTSCATTGYFYTANTPTDITNALTAMFNQAVQAAHLTQ